jgi:hypothetical protein
MQPAGRVESHVERTFLVMPMSRAAISQWLMLAIGKRPGCS